MRRINFEATVKGIYSDRTLRKSALRFSKQFEQVISGSLHAFAIEVRRRARLSLAATAGEYPSGSDTRYPKALRDAIDFDVDVANRSVEFEVGDGLPYARLHDSRATTEIMGNPTMRFYWYKIEKKIHLSRPAKVRRTGTGFFTKAFGRTVKDFSKIIDRQIRKHVKDANIR